MNNTAANSKLIKGRVSCSADSFMVEENAILRMNICGKITAIAKLQNVKGYAQPQKT